MRMNGERERKGFVWRVLARHVSASLLPSMHPPRVSRPRDDMGVYICPFIDTARLLANNAEENRRATLHHEQSTTGLIPLARAFAGECCSERGIYRRKCHWNSVESAVLKFLFLIDLSSFLFLIRFHWERNSRFEFVMYKCVESMINFYGRDEEIEESWVLINLNCIFETLLVNEIQISIMISLNRSAKNRWKEEKKKERGMKNKNEKIDR